MSRERYLKWKAGYYKGRLLPTMSIRDAKRYEILDGLTKENREFMLDYDRLEEWVWFAGLILYAIIFGLVGYVIGHAHGLLS